jgi:hypothetical protein
MLPSPFRPVSRRSRFVPGQRLIAIASLALALGCTRPLNLVSADSVIAPIDRVRIDAGHGVSFRSLDGAPARASTILVAPGNRSLRFEVRRNLHRLDEHRLEDVYRAGICRIRLETEAGEHYEVITRLISGERMVIASLDDTGKSKQLRVGMTIHVRNLTRDIEIQVPRDACDLRMDCRKIDRATLKPGPECSFE